MSFQTAAPFSSIVKILEIDDLSNFPNGFDITDLNPDAFQKFEYVFDRVQTDKDARSDDLRFRVSEDNGATFLSDSSAYFVQFVHNNDSSEQSSINAGIIGTDGSFGDTKRSVMGSFANLKTPSTGSIDTFNLLSVSDGSIVNARLSVNTLGDINAVQFFADASLVNGSFVLWGYKW